MLPQSKKLSEIASPNVYFRPYRNYPNVAGKLSFANLDNSHPNAYK